MFVKDQIVKNAGKKDALKHEDIPNNFTAQKRVLKFRVFDKVVQPLFAELRHATHLEKIR